MKQELPATSARFDFWLLVGIGIAFIGASAASLPHPHAGTWPYLFAAAGVGFIAAGAFRSQRRRQR